MVPMNFGQLPLNFEVWAWVALKGKRPSWREQAPTLGTAGNSRERPGTQKFGTVGQVSGRGQEGLVMAGNNQEQ